MLMRNGEKMTDKEYKCAKEYYEKGEYNECLDYIHSHLYDNYPRLCDFLLRSKCYLKLGKLEEMISFPWELIDYKYPSEIDLEAVELIKKYFELSNDSIEEPRFMNRCNYIRGYYDCGERIKEEEQWQSRIYKDTGVDETEILAFARYLFMKDDIVKSAFYHSVYLKISKNKNVYESDYLKSRLVKETNIELIYNMMLSDDTDSVAFVIDDMKNYQFYFNMAKACAYLNKKAYFFTAPITWEVEDIPQVEESLGLSYDAMEEVSGVLTTTSICYTNNGKIVESSLLSLLDDISKSSKGNQLLLFAEKNVFRTMKSKNVKRSALHYAASNNVYKNMPFQTNFGYINGYDNFYSNIYRVNVIDEIKKESKYAYSVVLPVRNNINTISSTLKTCLEQNFNDYEILISDNSDDDNQNIPRLLHADFDSEKIRYIRTPRVLPITKSFEYAYLKAQGDFLLPLGADDGLLFGALNKLDDIKYQIEKQDKVNLLTWDRLHYVWPSLNGGTQESQFIIPSLYRKNNLEWEKRESLAMLKQVIDNPNAKYGLPLCYINSGMKRDYLYTMLKETGAMLDGHSQDLYTGIIMLGLNEYYYHLKFPITVAALSNNSSGALSFEGVDSEKIVKTRNNEFYASNMLYPMQRDSEDLISISDGDTANMFAQLFRAIDMQCIPKEVIGAINWESIGIDIISQMNFNDMNRKKYERHLINMINLFSKESAVRLQQIIDLRETKGDGIKKSGKKQYFRGFDDKGGLHLDASEFGVKDVYDVCRLFNSICNIY